MAVNQSLRGKVAIVGAGLSPVGKAPDLSVLGLAAKASLRAIADAGLQKGDIDGVLSCPAFATSVPRMSVAIAEYLGITPTFSNTLQVSGATAAAMFNIGAAAIIAGLAEAILVVGSDSLFSGLTPDMALTTMSAESRDQQYEMPFGTLPANTFAMAAHRHMKEFGTTPEHLAEVAVISRRHASRTPGAQQTQLITVDDVLSSPLVTTPFHKLDCSLISDGAAAFVLVSADRAKALGIPKPVYILGAGECYTHEHVFLMPSLTSTGAVQSSRKAYDMAGYGPADMHTAGVYDCFTGTVISMVEDLGFCKKGEGGPFIAAGQTTYGGQVPVNTHGGLLSFAHSGLPGALFHFYEVVEQLRGQCGERQVEGVQLGLVHALGAGYATNATTILGTESTL